MENIKGMFSRKYGGVPAWLILLVAVGGVYLYMRHTGNSLFGGATDPNAGTGDGSAPSFQGQSPEIVFIPASGGPATNPQHKDHGSGPPATHTITAAQRAAAIMKDFRLHGYKYFKTHPGALAFLKANAPKDYRTVQASQTGKPKAKTTIRNTSVKGGGTGTRRQQPHSGKVKARG
jgi:hypothetical protein